MSNYQKTKKQIVLSILGIVSLVLVTVGVTYAIFTYTKLGETENTITTGTLKFLYTENSGIGNGISITNALPVSDTIGKNYATEGYVFDFKVEGTNTGVDPIGYEVTLRKKANSTLTESAVKVYLTDMTGGTETSIVEPVLYSKLTKTTVDVGTNIEKTLYQGSVASGEVAYLKNFRLRMWIDESSDFSDEKLNNQTFVATINVYANANVVSEPSTPAYESYRVGEAVTAIDGSKWHVLKNSDSLSDKVVLFSDYNLNADGSYNTTCQGSQDVDGSYICSPLAFDTEDQPYYDETDSANIGYFIKNTYLPKLQLALGSSTTATLPTAEQIAEADDQFFEDGSTYINSKWLTTTNYWTTTISGYDQSLWNMSGSSSTIYSSSPSTDSRIGVRPVITTLKTNLVK